MPVFIAEHAGFCMGVRRAVVEAMKAADMEKNIVTIGPLVHNPEVLRKLEAAGVRAVDTPEQASGRSAIIRSHGVAPTVYRELEERGILAVDLTCPFVKRLHDIVAGYSSTGTDFPDHVATPTTMDSSATPLSRLFVVWSS